EKLTAVLLVEDDLKGKFPVRRLPVNLTGDQEAKKDNHTPQLLKRLAPKLPVVLFGTLRADQFTLFAYSNGTWFQLVGVKGPEGERRSFACTPVGPSLGGT